jgi:DNA-directed RNA polymerase specialized sigma24 family protein
MKDSTAADDVFQRTAIRAWRGYSTFRGDSFLSWTLSIARNEGLREFGKRNKISKVETSLEALIEDSPAATPMATPAELESQASDILRRAVRASIATQFLSTAEAQVILARLEEPEAEWDQIGIRLGKEGGTCAVLHCRAIPKLRVFLFTHQPEFFGGIEIIAAALTAAMKNTADKLTSAEAEAFRYCVIDKRFPYRKTGAVAALRSACNKVIRHLRPFG